MTYWYILAKHVWHKNLRHCETVVCFIFLPGIGLENGWYFIKYLQKYSCKYCESCSLFIEYNL